MKKRQPKEEPVVDRRGSFIIPEGWSVVINSWTEDGTPIHHELWAANKYYLTHEYFQDICKQERVAKAQLLLFRSHDGPTTLDSHMRESILLEHYG